MLLSRVVDAESPPPVPSFVVGALPAPSSSSRLSLTSSPLRVTVPLRANDTVYGLGAGAVGTPTRANQKLRLMNRDTLFYGIAEATYAAFPLVWVRNDDGDCFVVVVLTTRPLDVAVDDDAIRFVEVVESDAVADVVVIEATPMTILNELRLLLGASVVPPAWALGFHQSRWSYRTDKDVLEVADDARRHDIPLDVIYLDIHMMHDYRVFSWHPRRFADPARLHQQLRERGVRTMAIIDPGLTTAAPSPVVDELIGGEVSPPTPQEVRSSTEPQSRLSLLAQLRAIDGLLKKADGTEVVGKVWPGDTVFPDYGKADVVEVIARAHRVLTDVGVAGFWNDMNDPVLHVGVDYDPLAQDVVHENGSHIEQRNLYANEMAVTTTKALEAAHPGQRHFVLSRSGFPGIQRHAALWTGDNFSSWEQLEESLHQVVHLGLSGVPWSGADIGGFGGRRGKYGIAKLKPSPELFVRWLELGALLPFCRVHSVLYGPRQEPWSFSSAVTTLSRRILRRRYALLGVLNTLARDAATTGMPIVRPLWLHHEMPSSSSSSSSSPSSSSPSAALAIARRQFMLGNDLLVAPVLDKGLRHRAVWLPEGGWVDVRDGSVVFAGVGGVVVDVDAALGDTPIFARAGAVLPTLVPGRNADDTLRNALTFEVFAPRAAGGRGRLILDDGVAADAHAVVDVGAVDEDGVIVVDVVVDHRGFVPHQTTMVLRVPEGFTVARFADGSEHEIVVRRLVDDDEGRRVVAEVVVPLRSATTQLR